MKQKLKNIVIDEAWDFMHDEVSKSLIEGLARRARKHNGPVITGSTSLRTRLKPRRGIRSSIN